MSIMVIAAVRDNRIETIEACLYDDTSDIGREEAYCMFEEELIKRGCDPDQAEEARESTCFLCPGGVMVQRTKVDIDL